MYVNNCTCATLFHTEPFLLSLQAIATTCLTQFNGNTTSPFILNLGTLSNDSDISDTWSVTLLNDTGSTVGAYSFVTGNQNLSATGQVASIRFAASNSLGNTAYLSYVLSVRTLNCFFEGTMISPQMKRLQWNCWKQEIW